MILKYNINNFYNIFWSGLTCISHHNTTFGYKFLAFKMNYLSCKYNFLVLTLLCFVLRFELFSVFPKLFSPGHVMKMVGL